MIKASLFKVFSLFLLLLISQSVIAPVFAYTLTTRESQSFDENLADQSHQQFALPKKILLTQVSSSAELLSFDSQNWVNLLYYYYITRLGFADIPYNYLIDRSGNIYTGRAGPEGVIPELQQLEGVILIGYLSNGSDISLSAKENMKEFVEDLSYKYGIEEKEVEVVDLIVQKGEEGELSLLSYEKTAGLFANEVVQALEGIEYFKDDHLSYKAEVKDLKYKKEGEIGDKIEVTMTLVNKAEIPWFTANDFIYLTTVDKEDSQFSVNGEWDSFDTPLHIEGKTILPGESVEIKFNLELAGLPDSYSESYEFTRLGNSKLEGGKFALKFEVNKGQNVLVQIKETGTGALNVRSGPHPNYEIIGFVDVGDLFIMLDEQAGWYKIKYNRADIGWVYGPYVRVL